MDSQFLSYLSSLMGGGAAGGGIGGINAMMGKGGEMARPIPEPGDTPGPMQQMQGPMPSQTNPLGTTASPVANPDGSTLANPGDTPPVNPLQQQLMAKALMKGGSSTPAAPMASLSSAQPTPSVPGAQSGGGGADDSMSPQQPQRQFRQQGGNQNLRGRLAAKQNPQQPMQTGGQMGGSY